VARSSHPFNDSNTLSIFSIHFGGGAPDCFRGVSLFVSVAVYGQMTSTDGDGTLSALA